MACHCQKEINDLKDFIKRWFVLVSRRFDDQEKNFFDQNRKLNEIHSYVFQLIENPAYKSSTFSFGEAPEHAVASDGVSIEDFTNSIIDERDEPIDDYRQPSFGNISADGGKKGIKVESSNIRIRTESNEYTNNEIVSGFRGNESVHYDSPFVGNQSNDERNTDQTLHYLKLCNVKSASSIDAYQSNTDAKVENSDYHSAISILDESQSTNDSSDQETTNPVSCGFYENQSTNNTIIINRLNDNDTAEESFNYLRLPTTANALVGAANQTYPGRSFVHQGKRYLIPTLNKSSARGSSVSGRNCVKQILNRSLTSSRNKIFTKQTPPFKSINLHTSTTSSVPGPSCSQSSSSFKKKSTVPPSDGVSIVDLWGDLLTYKKTKVVTAMMKNGSAFNYRFLHVSSLLPRKCGGYASIDEFMKKIEAYGFGTVDRVGPIRSHWMFRKKRFKEMTSAAKQNFMKLGVSIEAYEQTFAHGLIKVRRDASKRLLKLDEQNSMLSKRDAKIEHNRVQCTVCTKWYANNTVSKRSHSIKHLSEKKSIDWLFKCLLCAKTTMYKTNMQIHLNTWHGLANILTQQDGVHYESKVNVYEKEIGQMQNEAFPDDFASTSLLS